MHGRIGYLLTAVLMLAANTPANAACVDPARLAHSVVSITRHFDAAERAAKPNLIGVRGTGWFLSPTTMVTAGHVATAMKLSSDGWKLLEIAGPDGTQQVAGRIQRLAGAQPEKLAVIELQHSFSGAQGVAIRREPLIQEERVITLAYPAGHRLLVEGRFVRFGDGAKFAGTALLEMYEGDNRLAIDHGASGAPVVDCDGRVAAVVSTVFTQSFVWASREIRISTAWGTPNVVSVPIQALDENSKAD